MIMLLTLLTSTTIAWPEETISVVETRKILAAIVQAAEANAAKREKALVGDALLELYVTRAAQTALDERASTSAFVLALGIGLDPTEVVRSNPVIKLKWEQYESADERKRRIAVLGKPTLRKREDWPLHFFISAALTVQRGEAEAERLGLMKEMADAVSGSGFSFCDLAANQGGIALAQHLQKDAKLLTKCKTSFRAEHYLPSMDGLEENLTVQAFLAKYGSLKDARFAQMLDQIRGRVNELWKQQR